MNMSFMAIFGFFDDTVYTPLDMRIAGTSLVYMAILTPVYFFLLLLLERCALFFAMFFLFVSSVSRCISDMFVMSLCEKGGRCSLVHHIFAKAGH